MGWTAVLTQQAERDLAEIVAFIARDNPTAAERMGHTLIARAASLCLQPKLGITVLGWDNVRALLQRPYYLVYCCNEAEKRIEVLRFWHSARDIGALRLRDFDSI